MPNTIEKLIELLKDTQANADWHRWGYEEVADYLIANGVRLEEKQATSDENKWIPVKERLPEEDGYYLVAKKIFNNSILQEVLSFAKDGRKVDKYDFHREWKNVWHYYDSEWGHITVDSVTHWMPLPEPPKGE